MQRRHSPKGQFQSYSVLFLLLILTFSTHAQQVPFNDEVHPVAPNYALPENWSALPFRKDMADVLPKKTAWINDSLKSVDVFYVHPTTYRKGPTWNAGMDMKKMNRMVDKYPVRLQASVFNESCRVYAPRYRQAVVDVFYHPSEDGDKALDLAYQDVNEAFQYFLKNYNNGRPFIIAGHSQGAYHVRRLLREKIDGTELQKQMVAAYVMGYTMADTLYHSLKLCQNAEETECYVAWMSYQEGFYPEGTWFKNTQSVNPLTWTTDTAKVIKENYRGTVVLNPKRIRTRKMEVRIKDVGGNVLWVDTKAPWFRLMKNLHVGDFGLFYMDIRKNVATRIAAYSNK